MSAALLAVRAVQDESGHWYVIPVSMVQDFYSARNEMILEGISEVLINLEDEFEEKFCKYRTGGDLNNVQLYAKI
jgi:hypothetical protein